MAKTNEIFETEPCSRCDGTGHYSFNQMTGSRCFKCNGRTWTITKRGAAAQAAWFAGWKKYKPATEVVAGEKIIFVDAMRGNKRWAMTVVTSEADPLNKGCWLLHFGPDAVIGTVGYALDGEGVEMQATADEKQAAYEAISDMPGALGWKS